MILGFLWLGTIPPTSGLIDTIFGPRWPRRNDLGGAMPLSARITIIATLALICAGAAFLMIARGQALLIDLSATASRLLCF